MKSKEAVKIMRDKHKMFDFFKDQRSRSIKTNLGNLGVIEKVKQEAKEIYEKFKDGCEDKLCIGNCYNCQEIKQIYDAIHAIGETGGKDGN